MIHPAELNITPGITCLALKCSLGRKTVHDKKYKEKYKKCNAETDQQKYNMLVGQKRIKLIQLVQQCVSE